MLVIETTQANTAPAGLHKAKLTQVHDLGVETGQYGPREMVRLEFELDKLDPETGQPYRTWRKCSKSLNVKSTLRGIIEGLLGRPLSGEENRRIDLESLIGHQCLIQITHVERDGRTFSNVAAVLPVLQDEDENGGVPL